MPRVLTCVEWGTATEQCLTEAWVEQPSSVFTELPAEDGAAMGAAIFVLFAVAGLFRILKKNAEST